MRRTVAPSAVSASWPGRRVPDDFDRTEAATIEGMFGHDA